MRLFLKALELSWPVLAPSYQLFFLQQTLLYRQELFMSCFLLFKLGMFGKKEYYRLFPQVSLKFLILRCLNLFLRDVLRFWSRNSLRDLASFWSILAIRRISLASSWASLWQEYTQLLIFVESDSMFWSNLSRNLILGKG